MNTHEDPIRCPFCANLIPMIMSASFTCGHCGAALCVTLQSQPAAPSNMGVRMHSPGSNKIMVIKAVRVLTDLGLAEAKRLVEGPMPVEMRAANERSYRMGLNEFAASGAQYEDLGATAATSAPYRETVTATPRGDAPASLVVLHDGGRNKILVIKHIREVSGLGLREAKDLCDAAPTRFQVVQGHTIAGLTRLFSEAGARVEVR